jgi:hypothetical protein
VMCQVKGGEVCSCKMACGSLCFMTAKEE